ncbi:MAG: ATP-binding protein [Thermodesulfobacteriota bacterium]
MDIFKKRWVTEKLREAVSFSPVTVLTGARQTGKSTLLTHEEPFRSWRYVTMDDLDIMAVAAREPWAIIEDSGPLIIDEVQKVPSLLSTIKMAVDRERDRRFILSGSSNLLLMKGVSETLAGRAIYLDLFPFSYGEYKEKGRSGWISDVLAGVEPRFPEVSGEENIRSLLFRGFLPPVTELSQEKHISLWWRGYIATYLERDLRDVSRISNLPDFRKVMTLLALRQANILRQSEVARDAALSTASISRYVNLLEVSNLFTRLRPYSKNLSLRAIKSPKGFFIDPGLACTLAGFSEKDRIPEQLWGALFEGFFFLNLLNMAHVMDGDIYFLRTQGGKEKEVDFILDVNGRLCAFEVKFSERVGLRDAEGIRFLQGLLPRLSGGAVLYAGKEVKRLFKGIYAVPYWCL